MLVLLLAYVLYSLHTSFYWKILNFVQGILIQTTEAN